MGHRANGLKPSTLYVVVAVPQPAIRRSRAQLDYWQCIPSVFDSSSYETGCANGHGSEEFEWSVYWHRGPDDGVWYIPNKDIARHPASSTSRRPSYTLTKCELRRSPRLYTHVVGLVQLLHVSATASAEELTVYLDWLTTDEVARATRSCIWAACVYIRARRHIANWHEAIDRPLRNFNITEFLWETLEFVYSEVWYALGGQLPRPITVSSFASEVLSLTREQITDGATCSDPDDIRRG